MNEQTIKCPICGEPYTFYPFKAIDQSACPACIWKAKGKKMKDRLKKGFEEYDNKHRIGG